ncbi:hypothetical protein CY34DRAFT_108994 [Suillus luteus UH-Slu-Lm8-n1]|uniref:Uncharacterized protein n=1 Tax=Suillus luteus UH-Slu-Lm8-n1 TaxID=930992 RepID=A0A0C9ZJN1_9AGAM|nr:hypothetical protein CY34DRAFT_108994 [Suillus luteus UH-Slu-Lm8-n1]
MDVLGILDDDKELTRHLSQNQVLHIYNETQEEQLVSILHNLQDAKEEGGRLAVSKCLEAQHQKAVINRNTKLTKVLKHTRLMTVLIEDILPFGLHYRTRREFDITWLSKSINMVMGTSMGLLLEKVKQSMLKALDDDQEGHRSAEEKQIHKDIKAHTYGWLLDAHQDHFRMPLMTGYMMDRVWKELNTVKDGCTEAIFSAIEWERGMNVTGAVEAVYQTLFFWRVSAVLYLHNRMAELTMDEFIKAWNSMTEDTKRQAKLLYDQHKKFLGIGEINMPISSMGTPCMHGLLVTGWDWQHPMLKKNLGHKVEPLFQAMFLELRTAKKYRLTLLCDPIIYGLQDSLQKLMMEKLTKTKLKTATVGSLAKLREWTYWDGITVPRTMYQACLGQPRLTAEQADYDAICKIKKTIRVMLIAHVTHHKSSKVTMEVADAMNQLTKGVSSGGVVQEGTPGDGSDGNNEGEAQLPPRTSMKSPKGKGKDVEMEDNAEKQPVEKPVKTKPSPKPIPTKKATKAPAAKVAEDPLTTVATQTCFPEDLLTMHTLILQWFPEGTAICYAAQQRQQ